MYHWVTNGFILSRLFLLDFSFFFRIIVISGGSLHISSCIAVNNNNNNNNNNNTICIAPIKSEDTDTEALGGAGLSPAKQMCL